MNREFVIQPFGAFRCHFGGKLRVALPNGAAVLDLRHVLAEQLPDDNARALLKASVFASDERVLDDREPLPVDCELALLPPVCGG